MQRRSFLLSSAALALGSVAAPAIAAPSIISSQSRILPREGAKPRIVI